MSHESNSNHVVSESDMIAIAARYAAQGRQMICVGNTVLAVQSSDGAIDDKQIHHIMKQHEYHQSRNQTRNRLAQKLQQRRLALLNAEIAALES
jgi:hypothetical protein